VPILDDIRAYLEREPRQRRGCRKARKGKWRRRRHSLEWEKGGLSQRRRDDLESEKRGLWQRRNGLRIADRGLRIPKSQLANPKSDRVLAREDGRKETSRKGANAQKMTEDQMLRTRPRTSPPDPSEPCMSGRLDMRSPGDYGFSEKGFSAPACATCSFPEPVCFARIRFVPAAGRGVFLLRRRIARRNWPV